MVAGITINGETLILFNGETLILFNGETLVRSKSDPDVWHETTPTACDCLGFQYRSKCRHIEAVKAATVPKPAAPVSAEEFRQIVDEIWGAQ